MSRWLNAFILFSALLFGGFAAAQSVDVTGSVNKPDVLTMGESTSIAADGQVAACAASDVPLLADVAVPADEPLPGGDKQPKTDTESAADVPGLCDTRAVMMPAGARASPKRPQRSASPAPFIEGPQRPPRAAPSTGV